MNNALTVVEGQGLQSYAPQTPQQVLEQVGLIQEVMRTAMQSGSHYGTIPGCGDKPTLLKPGAEKLLFLFRFGTRVAISERDLGKGHREYQVTVSVFRQADGMEVGQGVGSCSTMEAKYRYRSTNTNKEVPREFWNSRDVKLLGGPSFIYRKVSGKFMIYHQVDHDNPADYYNTCLKMAKKRAQVDATLTATAASDCFTQDIEDIKENLSQYSSEEEETPEHVATHSAPKPQAPKPAVQPAAATTQPQETSGGSGWRNVQIHFGKNKGVSLGSMMGDSLKWYIEKWEPKPWPEGSTNYKQVDLDLRMALNQADAEFKAEANNEGAA